MQQNVSVGARVATYWTGCSLRFASDAELPGLVKRALDENLTEKQIKQAIVTWKPDYLRV